jgi:hypothetical protein
MNGRPGPRRLQIRLWHIVLINLIALVLFVIAYRMHQP